MQHYEANWNPETPALFDYITKLLDQSEHHFFSGLYGK